jgi:O-6-methylguanine DNA methyltransferase
MLRHHVLETSIGWVGVALSPRGLRAVTLPKASEAAALAAVVDLGAAEPATPDELGDLPDRLRRFAEGDGVAFDDATLDPEVGTPFQRAVWDAIRSIPRGETRSYRWIAERIGRPNAVRAVGQAVGSNPWPLLVPCHRVIAADGRIGGFAGGLEMKRRLLGLEGRPALVP